MERAPSLKHIAAGFGKALQAIGIDSYHYQIIRVANSIGRLPYVISNFPEAWLARYAAEEYLDDDPIIGEATRRKLPFLWSDVTRYDDLSLRQRTLLAQAGSFGIRNGLSVPLSGNGASCAVVSFVVSDDSGAANGVLRENSYLLHLLAIYLHSRACGLLLDASADAAAKGRRVSLTVREREVLGWVARGKSACEIALILVISKKSVEFSVETAKRKLQVFNRTHAVVKALELGLISASG